MLDEIEGVQVCENIRFKSDGKTDYLGIKGFLNFKDYRKLHDYLTQVGKSGKMVIDVSESEASSSPLIALVQEAEKWYGGRANFVVLVTCGSVTEDMLNSIGFSDKRMGYNVMYPAQLEDVNL